MSTIATKTRRVNPQYVPAHRHQTVKNTCNKLRTKCERQAKRMKALFEEIDKLRLHREQDPEVITRITKLKKKCLV